MNYAAYFAIEKQLRQKGFKDDRSDLILQFTNGRKKGLSQLSAFEYKEFCRWLNLKFQTGEPKQAQNQDPTQYDPANLQRRKIIALFWKMGYKTKDGKSDISAVNTWAQTHGHLHKPLNSYSLDELPKLVTQAENMFKSFIEGI